MKIRAHVFVEGKVQGVSFRYSVVRKAVEIGGLGGWVRNLEDGRVEIVVEGEKGNVDKLAEFCRKGPEKSVVKKIDIIEEKYTGEFAGFERR